MTKLGNDLVASLVVFLVALPLCMGIAIASGVPPALGLITGIVGGLVVGSISGSPLQVSGPAAGLAVLVFEFVRGHGIEMLGPVLFLAGAIQLIAGLSKLGQWFRAMTPDVIFGMLAGIGILIFAAQFHVMLDDQPKANGLMNLISIPTAIWGGIFPINGSKHELAALVGLGTIVCLLLWEKFRPAKLKVIPGALVGVVVATATTQLFQLPLNFVDIPDRIVNAVTLPGWDNLSAVLQGPLLLTALAIAFIASAETLLSAAAVDQMHAGPRTNFDRELMAQGVGNTLCGFLGALPMTGVIVRSAANVNAGAKTRLSAMLHGAWLLVFVFLAPGVLRLVPISALAAILVYTGFKLVNLQHMRTLARYGRIPLLVYAGTVITIVSTDLLTGVLVGIGLSLVKLIYKMTHLRIDVDKDQSGRRMDVGLDGAATFLSMPRLASLLDGVPPGTEVHIRVDKLTYIDHACIEMLNGWRCRGETVGSKLVVEWETLIHRYQRTPATEEQMNAVASPAQAGH
jgi:MFS superfamily sulfate permease-like transporter